MLYEYLLVAVAHLGGIPPLTVIIVPAPGAASTVINRVAQYWIGTAGQDARTGYWAIQSQASGWTGSVTIKARAAGSHNTFQETPYTAWHLNGGVSDGASHSDPITTDSSWCPLAAKISPLTVQRRSGR